MVGLHLIQRKKAQKKLAAALKRLEKKGL
jgi:hypothetical protein